MDALYCEILACIMMITLWIIGISWNFSHPIEGIHENIIGSLLVIYFFTLVSLCVCTLIE